MKALKAAVAFLPRAWAGAWLVLGLMFAVLVGGPLLMGGDQLPLMFAPLVFFFSLLLLKLVAQGALYRIALFGKDARAEGLGFGGLQIARPELRLLLATLSVAAFMVLIATAIFLVFAIALSLSGLAAGYENSMTAVSSIWRRHTGADYVFIVYIVAAVLFLLFVALKFTLMPAANVAGRKLVTLNALGLSSGHVGKLFVGLLAIISPFVVVCALAVRHFAYGSASIFLHTGLIALSIFLLMPLTVGFLTSAYRQIMAIRSK